MRGAWGCVCSGGAGCCIRLCSGQGGVVDGFLVICWDTACTCTFDLAYTYRVKSAGFDLRVWVVKAQPLRRARNRVIISLFSFFPISLIPLYFNSL